MKDADKTLEEVFHHIAVSQPALTSVAIEVRRRALSKLVNDNFNGMVKYGPFKGMKLTDEAWWGGSDRGSMLLGLYEQEVLSSLTAIRGRYRNFIDIGAADGYYGIGVLVGKIFEKSYCYEISEKGQTTIKSNAQLNDVLPQIEVRGRADRNFVNDFTDEEAESSVLFVDVEGAEFELLSDAVFSKFRKSVIIVELHDWFFADGEKRLNSLRSDAEKFFNITPLTTTNRDPSLFPELRGLSDTDRWLICSEGRGRLMTWFRLDPL